jgi:hypothetical protein
MMSDDVAKLLHGYFDAIAAGKLEPTKRLTETIERLVNPTLEQKTEQARELVTQMISVLKSLDRSAPERAAELGREAMLELAEFSGRSVAIGRPARSKNSLQTRNYVILATLKSNSRVTSEQIESNVRRFEPEILDNTLTQHLSKLVSLDWIARPEPGYYVPGKHWQAQLDKVAQKLREVGENLPKL